MMQFKHKIDHIRRAWDGWCTWRLNGFRGVSVSSIWQFLWQPHTIISLWSFTQKCVKTRGSILHGSPIWIEWCHPSIWSLDKPRSRISIRCFWSRVILCTEVCGDSVVDSLHDKTVIITPCSIKSIWALIRSHFWVDIITRVSPAAVSIQSF